MSTEAPRRRLHGWLLVLALAALLTPLAAGVRFPSQDGPAHLENASILLQLSGASAAELRDFYVVNPQVHPTWLGHLLLAALVALLPALVADKVAIGLCVVALPLAFAYAARGLCPTRSGWGAALVALPFAWSYLVHMGFYSFCWSLATGLAALGYFLHRPSWSPKSVLVLALLTLFAWALHPFGALLAGLVVASIGVLDLLLAGPKGRGGWLRSARDRLAIPLLALLPAAVLTALYASRTAGDRVAFLPLELRAQLFLSLDVLVAWGGSERALAVAFAATLVVGGGIALVARFRSGSLMRSDGIVVAALAVAGACFVAPNRIGELSWMSHRLALMAWILWALWLEVQAVSPETTRMLRAACTLVAFLFVAVRWPTYRELDDQLAEYVGVARSIPAGATMLGIALAPRGLGDLPGEPLSQKVQPFLNAAGFVAVERGAIDLGNYEPSSARFPLVFRPEVDPYRHLATPADLRAIPPRLDFEGFERRTGRRVEYLLVWGRPNDLPPSPGRAAFLAELSERYELVDVSQPRGAALLFRHKGP